MLSLRPGMEKSREEVMKKLVNMQYARNEIDFKRGTFRAKGDIVEIYPSDRGESAIRVEFWGDEIEKISEINPLTGKTIGIRNHVMIFPNSHYATTSEKMERAITTIEKEMEEIRKMLEKDLNNFESTQTEQKSPEILEFDSKQEIPDVISIKDDSEDKTEMNASSVESPKKETFDIEYKDLDATPFVGKHLENTYDEKEEEIKKEDIYTIFEKEFGRTLSSMDYEIINAWIDNGFSEELVIAALKEAVYNGVPNLRYIDKNTMSFCITPLLEKEYNDFVEENKIEENNKSVSRNKYNEFNKIVLEKEKIAKKYFDDYIYNAVSNSEEAYKLLNEEYRTKRFPNINEYKEYIKQNIEQLETLDAKGIKSFEEFNDEDKYKEYIGKLQLKGIEQYNITNKDKYKQIECVDVYGNYYLFNVKAAMDYTVILDAYTIDLPDVLEKYNSSSNENKVAMNIEKIKTAINNKDYRYVYNKLNNTFKETNFKTEESLKEYLQSNIYINNNFECSSVQKQDNVYVAQVKVMNMDNTTQTKKIKVVMKLKEGTDYEMSFSIQ